MAARLASRMPFGTFTVVGAQEKESTPVGDIRVRGLTRVEGFLDDVAGSAFSDSVGVVKSFDSIGEPDDVNISLKVECPSFTWEFRDLVAHDAGCFGRESIKPLRTPSQKLGVRRERLDELRDLHRTLNNRERGAPDDGNPHSSANQKSWSL